MATLNSRMRLRLGRTVGSATLAVCGLLATAIGAGLTVAGSTAASAATPAAASGDAPAGFWYGTDSSYILIGGHPYREPVIGGTYGGYIGMIGNWAHWQGCGGIVVWSKANAAQARTDLLTYHSGVGTGAYWFMAGPGVDPHYNGTYSEAFKWGEEQAAVALAELRAKSPRIRFTIIWMDVELPGDAPRYTPAPDNGWNSVYTSPCSGQVRIDSVPANVDRGDINGFADYMTANSYYKVGAYSAPSVWTSIFGTGSDATLTNTYEWTYTGDTASLSHHPDGWCLAGTKICAQFFGGMTSSSKYALMWQWSGGGGTYNGTGDFDQIDANRNPS